MDAVERKGWRDKAKTNLKSMFGQEAKVVQ